MKWPALEDAVTSIHITAGEVPDHSEAWPDGIPPTRGPLGNESALAYQHVRTQHA